MGEEANAGLASLFRSLSRSSAMEILDKAGIRITQGGLGEIIVYLNPEQNEAVANAVEKFLATKIILVGDFEESDHILEDFVHELEEAVGFYKNR